MKWKKLVVKYTDDFKNMNIDIDCKDPNMDSLRMLGLFELCKDVVITYGKVNREQTSTSIFRKKRKENKNNRGQIVDLK